ncbi:MAG: hypothetical protein H0V27_01440 [Pyrinomonadaceae bacterium]|jgi:hypothetical protein|nr:hypothetical protein [Pyrinomonadaceae bacterium]
MKNLKNAISLFVGFIMLLALVSPSVIAQKKSKRQRNPSVRIVKCDNNDSDCFIRAANTCQKATLTMTKPLLTWNPNVPHPTHTQVTRYEIRGRQNGKCTFYSKLEKNDIEYSEDYIRYVMKEESKTRQEVEQIMLEERQAFQQTVGRDGVCSFQTEKLVAMLNRWWQKDGGVNISTKDFEGANCQGTLYNFTLPNQTIELSQPPSAKPPQ